MLRATALRSSRWLVGGAVMAFACPDAAAAVVFQDDFENPTPRDWTSADDAYPPWTGKSSDATATCAGVTKHAGSIESPGRGGSGASLRLNRCNGFPTEMYAGYLDYVNTDSSLNKLYARWYWKLPADANADLGDAQYLKVTRWVLDGGQSTIYLNFNGSSLRGAELQIYPSLSAGDFSSQPASTWYSTGLGFLDVADGNWHHFEMMVDVAETGRLVMEAWADGTSVWTFDENLGPRSGLFIRTVLTPGLGNSASNSAWSFPTSGWAAFEWDDYVLSTTYVGLDGAPPMKTPGAPSGLTVE